MNTNRIPSMNPERVARARAAVNLWERTEGADAEVEQPRPGDVLRYLAQHNRSAYGNPANVTRLYSWDHTPMRVRAWEPYTYEQTHRDGTVTVVESKRCSNNHQRLDTAPALALARRYRALREYLHETRHAWEPIKIEAWADNSADVIERSRLTGETRRASLISGGDLPYTYTIRDGQVYDYRGNIARAYRTNAA